MELLSEADLAQYNQERSSVSIHLHFEESDPLFTPEILRSLTSSEQSKPTLQVSVGPLSDTQDILSRVAEGLSQLTKGTPNEIVASALSLWQHLGSKSHRVELKSKRLFSSYRLSSSDSIFCTRRSFLVRTVLHLTSKKGTQLGSLSMQHSSPSSALTASTLRLPSSLSTPRELVEIVHRASEHDLEGISGYYGAFLPREERWLELDSSLAKNRVLEGDFLEIKIEPHSMPVLYCDLVAEKEFLEQQALQPVEEEGESQEDVHCERVVPIVTLTVEVDFTIPLVDIIFSQLLGSLTCNRRDVLEVRISEAGSCEDPSVPRQGRLLRLSESLALQGVQPGEHVLHIFRLEEGRAGGEHVQDDTNIWEPGNKNDLVLEKLSGGKEIVIAGTLNRLVEYLTNKIVEDADFLNAFFYTYPMFTSEDVLFKKFVQRFHVPMPVDVDHQEFLAKTKRPTQVKVANAIRHWIERCGHTFDDDLTQSIQLFVTNHLETEDVPQLAALVRSALTKVQTGVRLQEMRARQISVARPKFKSDVTGLKFVDFDDEEIARQLCLTAQNVFCGIGVSRALLCR